MATEITPERAIAGDIVRRAVEVGAAIRAGEDIEILFSTGTRRLAKNYATVIAEHGYLVKEREFSFFCTPRKP